VCVCVGAGCVRARALKCRTSLVLCAAEFSGAATGGSSGAGGTRLKGARGPKAPAMSAGVYYVVPLNGSGGGAAGGGTDGTAGGGGARGRTGGGGTGGGSDGRPAASAAPPPPSAIQREAPEHITRSAITGQQAAYVGFLRVGAGASAAAAGSGKPGSSATISGGGWLGGYDDAAPRDARSDVDTAAEAALTGGRAYDTNINAGSGAGASGAGMSALAGVLASVSDDDVLAAMLAQVEQDATHGDNAGTAAAGFDLLGMGAMPLLVGVGKPAAPAMPPPAHAAPVAARALPAAAGAIEEDEWEDV